jgi:hypothetical protein
MATQTPTKPGLFTAEQAASYIGLKPSGIKWLSRTGRLPSLPIGRSKMYLQSDLDEFIGRLHQKAAVL